MLMMILRMTMLQIMTLFTMKLRMMMKHQYTTYG